MVLGVVISVLVLNAFVLSVDISVLVYNIILAVDIAVLRMQYKGGGVQGILSTQARGWMTGGVRHERTNLGVDMGVLGVDMVNLRRRRNEEGERPREGEVSRVGRLGGG